MPDRFVIFALSVRRPIFNGQYVRVMGLLNKLFGANKQPADAYENFWNWFQENAKSVHKVVKEKGNVEKDFFSKLSPKLDEVKEGLLFSTGMADDKTVELVITANGTVKNFVFAEELVEAAPKIEGWEFTALIPAMDIKDVSLDMSGYKFNGQNLSFHANEEADFLDEIDVTIVHAECTNGNRSAINDGIFIFLDNYLGEQGLALVDNIIVATPEEAEKELVPIGQLKDFVNRRQKELSDKHEGVKPPGKPESYALIETELRSGDRLIAVINTELLNWEHKTAYPWTLQIDIPFEEADNNGLAEKIEEEITASLNNLGTCLKIGRQTTNAGREIYFVSRDFRMPSKLAVAIQKEYADRLEIGYDLYLDKYWSHFNRFKKKDQ